jgi:adenine-specific DNA-methyltransferase
MRLVEFQESLKNILLPNVSSELNFGMYKILNLKKQIILGFIENVLEDIINNSLQEYNFLSKEQIYNDLYNFFSKYYKEGGLVVDTSLPTRHPSLVTRHISEGDRYFIKTGILLKDYAFKSGEYNVVFKVVKAKDEIASNKPKKRFFVLDNDFIEEISDNGVIIRFQYKELDNADQKRLNEETYSILERILSKDDRINRILIQKSKNGKPLLLYHLNKFTTQKQLKDFFIYKDLAGFLTKQLDYYIKSDVLDFSVENISRAKVVKDVGEEIIRLLSKFEDFQKQLWERRRFVVMTEYVITLDRIKAWTDERFYEWVLDKVMGNAKQLEEWENLGFGSIKSKDEIKDKTLPIDTRYFNEGFKFMLLEKISENIDIDDALDGLLIKSESYQALNTLLPKFKEKVQTIYIDPPFNKDQEADYLYNVKFEDATWITMLENRLRLAKEFLNEKGSIFVRCDYNGNWIVRCVMDEIFGKENFRNEIQVKRMTKLAGTTGSLDVANDSLFLFSKSQSIFIKSIQRDRICRYCKQPKKPEWVPLEAPGDSKNDLVIINGKKFYARKNSHWTFKQDVVDELFKKGLLRINESRSYVDKFGNRVYGLPEYLQYPFQEIDNDWTDIPGYSSVWNFQTENSEILLKRVIELTSNEGDIVIDFFSGSGTTIAVAHKLKRKWIGIEMGEHFYTVILPRMKKVLAYDKSGISKEKDVKEKYNQKNAGGFFKYQILEQYEDVIDNLEDNSNYIKHPFDYKRKINLSEVGEPQEINIDVVETFIYEFGIKVKKIKRTWHYRKMYVFVIGEKDGKNVAIAWKEAGDCETIENFIKKQIDPYNVEILYEF